MYDFCMKKIALICIPLVLALAFGVCALIVVNNHKRTIYAQNLTLNITVLNLEVGESYRLGNDDFKISPSNCTEKSFFSVNDTLIAIVDNVSGLIKTKKVGNCIVTISIKSGEESALTKQVEVVVNEKTYYPQNITLSENYVVVAKSGSTALNFEIEGKCNVKPQITIENGNISYDYETNKLCGVEVGNDTLTICFQMSKTEKKTFVVGVKVTKKQIITKNCQVTLSDEPVDVEYKTPSDFENVSCEVIKGQMLAEVVSFEYGHLVLLTKDVGSLIVEIDSTNAKIVLYVEIIKSTQV